MRKEYLTQIREALESKKGLKADRISLLMSRLDREDVFKVKKILTEIKQELEEIRKENHEISTRIEEIKDELGKIKSRKLRLKERALECSLEDFTLVQEEIDLLNDREDELELEREELGDPEIDSDIDKQRMDTTCEEWGNPLSEIDNWAGMLHRVKVLLNRKLEGEI